MGDGAEVDGLLPQPAAEDYRYERKFAVETLEREEIESILRLNPAAFSPVYQPRWVNSTYLETLSNTFRGENLAGTSQDRVKIRVRWYGAFEGFVDNARLELKIKQGATNRKVLFDLAPFNVDRTLTLGVIRDLFRKAEMPAGLTQDLLKLEPALAVRYHRSYLVSVDRRFRVTIDSKQRFQRLRASGPIIAGRWFDAPYRVVELKYETRHDGDAHRISQHFPFRMTRNSKYVAGLELADRRMGLF